MEYAGFLVTLVLGLFSAGAFVGYHFRDFVGKEVAKFAAALVQEHAKLAAQSKAELTVVVQTLEADKAKVIDAVKSAIEKQAQKI